MSSYLINPFDPGALVVVSLGSPREKFFGALLELTAAGVSVVGVDLNSLDDFALAVKHGEGSSANTVFFPMHRVERIEADAPAGEIPSLRQRFEQMAGEPIELHISPQQATRYTGGIGE
jgi:hypothetical protein